MGLVSGDIVRGDPSVLRFVVLEFYVETIFDTDLHLNGVVAVWWHAEGMHPDIFLFVDIRHTTRNGHSDEVSCRGVKRRFDWQLHDNVPQLHVDPLIALILFLDILKVEVVSLCLSHLAWRSKLLRK